MARRTNLKKAEGGLQEGIEALSKVALQATAQWRAERQLDRDAIAAHVEDVRAEIEWIAAWESQQIDHVRACALQMRERQSKRLASLQGHLADLDSAELIEGEREPKRLNGKVSP